MKIKLSKKIYSYEALVIAKNVIDKNDIIRIKRNKDLNILEIKDPINEELIYALLNEALSQQCRIDTLNKNKEIAQMITTTAILNALKRS